MRRPEPMPSDELAEWLTLPPEGEHAPRRPLAKTLAPARTLGEILADPEALVPPPVVVPHLAIAGRCTLLSGREKSGKSTLTAQLVAAASTGAPVLGVPLPAPITTLWYAIDEPQQDAARRFAEMGAHPDRVILSDAPRNVSELVQLLPEDCARYQNVSLVVVDTLSRLFSGSGVDVNQSDKVEPSLWALVELFRKHNVASVLLYHTGKGGAEYRGSTAIGATVDEILTLRGKAQENTAEDFDAVDDTDDGRRVLVQNGRNLRGRVRLAFHGGRYGIFDETHPPRARILEALEDGPAKNRSDLAKRAKVQKQSGLALIGELIAIGDIVETGEGLARGSRRFPSAASGGTGTGAGTAPESLAVPRFPSVPLHGTAPEPTQEPPRVLRALPVPEGGGGGGGEPEPPDMAI